MLTFYIQLALIFYLWFSSSLKISDFFYKIYETWAKLDKYCPKIDYKCSKAAKCLRNLTNIFSCAMLIIQDQNLVVAKLLVKYFLNLLYANNMNDYRLDGRRRTSHWQLVTLVERDPCRWLRFLIWQQQRLSDSLTGVKCRATSVAKKIGTLELLIWHYQHFDWDHLNFFVG